MYRFRKIVGKSGFSGRFEGLVGRYRGVGCGLDIVRQTACLLSTQSLLMAVLRSLVARRQFGPRARWRPLRGTLASGLGLGGVSGLARRSSAIGFHVLWHTVGLAMSARLCLLQWLI